MKNTIIRSENECSVLSFGFNHLPFKNEKSEDVIVSFEETRKISSYFEETRKTKIARS